VNDLRPNGGRARILLDLVQELSQEDMAAVIPGINSLVDLVGLVDGVDGGLDFPQVLG